MLFLGVMLFAVGISARGLVRDIDGEVSGGKDDALIGNLPSYVCPKPGGAFPWTSCDKFVVCVDSAASLWQCKLNHFFDLMYEGCNFPEYTDCGNRTLPGVTTPSPVTTTISGGNTPSFVCPEADGSFRNPYDCASFYICSSNYAIIVTCKGDLVYNSALQVCDYQANVDCSDISTVPSGVVTTSATVPTTTTAATTTPATTTTSTTTPATTTTATTTPATTTPATTTTAAPGGTPSYVCPRPDGSFRNPYECSSFYVCSNSNPTLVNCLAGLVYNPDLEVCDYPAQVDCSDITAVPPKVTTTTTTVTTTLPTTTTAPTTTTTPTTTTAPTTTTTPTTTTPTTTTTAPFSCSGLNDGIHPDPENCSSFYQCVNGKPIHLSCPPSLTYNPAIQSCDYPGNVPPPCGTYGSEE